MKLGSYGYFHNGSYHTTLVVPYNGTIVCEVTDLLGVYRLSKVINATGTETAVIVSLHLAKSFQNISKTPNDGIFIFINDLYETINLEVFVNFHNFMLKITPEYNIICCRLPFSHQANFITSGRLIIQPGHMFVSSRQFLPHPDDSWYRKDDYLPLTISNQFRYSYFRSHNIEGGSPRGANCWIGCSSSRCFHRSCHCIHYLWEEIEKNR